MEGDIHIVSKPTAPQEIEENLKIIDKINRDVLLVKKLEGVNGKDAQSVNIEKSSGD